MARGSTKNLVAEVRTFGSLANATLVDSSKEKVSGDSFTN